MVTKFKKRRNFSAKTLISRKFSQRIIKPKKAKEVLKELKNKNIYSLAPICWIIFADISVPFSKLSFKDKLFM